MGINGINSRDLDNYITGHYGEDQFRDDPDDNLCPDDYEDMAGHEYAFRMTSFGNVYTYDPAEDGPECEVITRILAHHPLYIPGRERDIIRKGRLMDLLALHLYQKSYAKLAEQQRYAVLRALAERAVHTGKP